MLKNYILLTMRTIKKNKIYSAINIIGLAIGLACFILIMIFIKHELSFDTFHEKVDRIYRPVEIQYPPGIGTQHVAVTMGPLAPALVQDFPEIESATRIFRLGTILMSKGEVRHYEEEFVFADPQIFKNFTLPLIMGNPESILKEPNSLVISETIAKKYFGDKNPIGQMLTGQHYWGKDEFIISGVMKDYPENSHLNFEIISSYALIETKLSWLQSWGNNTLATYVLLKEGTNIAALEAKFPEFVHKYDPDEKAKEFGLYLQPLKDIHLHSGHIRYQTFNYHQGSINAVYTFSAIAIFILLLACINFMNLATARSAKRAKEVGIRKVLGSHRRDLIYQFISESILVTFIALVLALIVLEVFFPYFQSLIAYNIPKYYYADSLFILQIISITLLVGFIAGSYPAFFLSNFKPVHTLKKTFSGTGKGAVLRKVLVVFQFSIAVALIASTGIVMDQMNFIKNKDMGFNTDQVVYIRLRGKESRDKYRSFKDELLRNTYITGVSATSGLTGGSGSQGTITTANEAEEKSMMMRWSFVDFDYISTMEMQVVQGRDFSPTFSADTTTSVIINEAAVAEFGWDNPIGKRFKAGEEEPDYEVIGVVNDFHFYSLHQKIEPLIMWNEVRRFNFLIARIATRDISAALASIENSWKSYFPEHPLEISFLDKYMEELYKREQNTGKLFGSFSFLAIFIACLGLFGLASFTAEQKTKEIGIRKVVGASVQGIIFLLTKEFTKWVMIACLIGFPLAYLVMQKWLQMFVYKTDISALTFITAALIVILIALITVGFQAIRASVANPIKAMRYE
jgi:putative ABC transport system permease protein